MAPAVVAKLCPGFEVPLCRIDYSCDINGGRPTEDFSSRLRDLSAIELALHFVFQHSYHELHLIGRQQTCDSL